VEDPEGWRGHVVVCGLHDEGLRVLEQLRVVGVRAVGVDDEPDPRLLGAVGALGVPFLTADSRLPDTLRAAGLAGASALVCVESEDLHTLATALAARELRPDLRVVVQLRNAALGRALQELGIAVLDVAGLAAPSVVEACLRTGRRTLRLGAVEVVVAETLVQREGTLRELYGDLAPVAVVPAGSGETVVSPGRDAVVRSGDRVVVLGEPGALDDAGLRARRAGREKVVPTFVGARAPRPPRPPRNPWVRDLVRGVDRGVKVAVAGLLGLAALSVTLLLVGYQEPSGRRMSPLDALYFTVETIGTVGYGDFYFRDQHWWLRLWAILLMVVGATLATVFFALLTNALVSRRLEESLGRRRIGAVDDHVVVVGLGSIGVRVVRELVAAGVEVVVLERDVDNRFRAELRALRVPVVVGDATQQDTWRDLAVDRSWAVAVLTSSDLANLETGLAAKDLLGERWAETPVVLRLFDRQLAGTVRGSFGFRHVVSPAALAAPWFVGAALGLDVVDTFYVGDQPMLAARLPVASGGGLDGLAMRELAARIRVVALARADGTVERLPRRDTRLSGGDTAYLVGPYEELLRLLRTDAAATTQPA
jgi:Trk K+ transport system NAD-binding subunit